jgi:hypothetical protein
MRPELQLRLAALVRESLGDPAHYTASTDKTRLPAAAEALGLRVPPYALCAALYAAVAGTATTSRADLAEGDEGLSVYFPGEWLRDPDSRYLRDYPVDVPWDEPELIEALLAVRHER